MSFPGPRGSRAHSTTARSLLTPARASLGRLLAAVLVACTLLAASSPRAASADTVALPYGMIVMLQIRMPQADITCTGFMIGPHTIATAAHCLYNRQHGGWASSAFVTPGLDGLNAPYATEWATSFEVSPTWVQTQDLTADYGAITLGSDALGNATGWFDLAMPTNYELATGSYTTAGYGTSTRYGTLWRLPRPQLLADYDRAFLAYDWGTSTGESGAPIFEPRPGDRYRAVGMVKGAFDSPEERVEFGLRVTGSLLTFYRDQINRPTAAPVQQAIPTMFSSVSGVATRVTGPVTRANTAASLQSSVDQVTWTTAARATTDADGVATFGITPTETRYYRVVVEGVGTGRVARGNVTGSGPSRAGDRGSFVGAPTYSSSRNALAVFQGGTTAEFSAALERAGAAAAWAQDGRGEWILYIVGGTFVNDPFLRAFPSGFAAPTPTTLVAP